MEIGPFNIRDTDVLKELFESNGIEFSILIDKEAETEIISSHNKSATISPRYMAGRLDLKTVYFEISEEDFYKIKSSLEKYGIVAPTDGSYELGDE
jgi:hypothetical protein